MKLYQKIKELGPEYEITLSNKRVHIIYRGVSIANADREKGINPKEIECLDDFIEQEARKYDREYEIMSFINYPINYLKNKIKKLFK